MSDLIKSIGSAGPRKLQSAQLEAKSPVQKGTPGGQGTDAAAVPKENVSLSPEVNESSQDTKAAEATASTFLGAWSGATPTATAQGGTLAVQGLESTSVNQVHSTANGLHSGSQGPQAGLTAGTVYSTRPPTA